MSPTHLSFEDVQKLQHQLQRVSDSVTFNQEGSFTCRKRAGPMVTAEQFARDLQRIVSAVRRSRIEILENRTEQLGPDISNLIVRFMVLR